jgi:hypothetical protein
MGLRVKKHHASELGNADPCAFLRAVASRKFTA